MMLNLSLDMKLHLAADGGEVDAVEIGYAAGLYSYLWAAVMAADVAAAFAESPGGLYDEATAQAYRDALLTVGHRVPADEAFRNFLGRDPDPMALLRRFGLEAAAPLP